MLSLMWLYIALDNTLWFLVCEMETNVLPFLTLAQTVFLASTLNSSDWSI